MMAKATTEFISTNLSHPKHLQNLQGRWALLLAPLQVLGRLWWEMLLLSPSSPNCLKSHKGTELTEVQHPRKWGLRVLLRHYKPST